MRKGSILLLIIVVVAVATVAGGYYIGNKSSAPTSNPTIASPTLTDENTTLMPQNTSPDGSFVVTEELLADYYKISVKKKSGQIITEDLVANNTKELGYNVKYKCMCAARFKQWIDNATFSIKVNNGGGEEYEFLVDAQTGKVNESTFKRTR